MPGRLFSRFARKHARTSPLTAGERKDVLFLFDQPGAWTRYRCDHQAEAAQLAGLSCDLVQTDCVDLVEAVDHYDSFVLNRVEMTEPVAAFCERARARERTLVFDTDDLIFEPELIHHFAVFDGWPEPELMLEVAKLDGYRRTLEACTAATVTTEPLREFARRRVEDVRVVPNAVSDEMVRLADKALAAKRKGASTVIAYLSGTRTHNRDFLEAADAVLWALEEYPQVRFRALGKLELDERFEPFRERVERMPMQPWQALPKLLRRIDVNLAPLEGANPVTECKSCVKYLEAGLVGVPTIASPRPDFVRVIDHGRNGLLAETTEDWCEALRLLVKSPTVSRQIGGRAADDTRKWHTTAARAPLIAETFTRHAVSR